MTLIMSSSRGFQMKNVIDQSLADLGLIPAPPIVDDMIYQVQFKFQCRFCANASNLRRLPIGEFVIIDCGNDQIDLGVVKKIFTPEQFVNCEQNDKQVVSRGNIIRTATQEERAYLSIKHTQEIKLFRYCKHLVECLQLDIRVFGVDYQFDGNLVTLYYTCHSPVNMDAMVEAMYKSCGTPVKLQWTARRIRYSAKSLASRSLVTGKTYVA